MVFTPTLTIVNNFCGTIDFQVSGLPTGATASAPPVNLCANSPQTAQISVTVAPGTPQGTSQLGINAYGANGNAGQDVNQYLNPILQVGSGGSTFSISASAPQTTAPGGTAQYTITVNGSGGLGNVTLTASGGPPWATVLLNGSSSASVPVGGSASLTVATPANEGLGIYPVSITGMLGTVPKYASALLTVSLPAAASMLTPPPGANIAGGNTVFTWNAGLGATQYTVTAVAANGQTSSAATGPGQLSATLSLPATSQTATVTLQTMTASGAPTQNYTYTIQPSGTAQPLTLRPGNTMPALVANGQEVLYTFAYNSPGGARPSPQDIEQCLSTEVAIGIRIADLRSGSATLGFTAPIGTATLLDWTWECDDGGGTDSGGSGTGSTGDPTPNIDSVSPVPISAGPPAAITINGEYFGSSAGYLDFEGGCSQVGNASWTPDGTTITVSVAVDPSASGYCTVAVDVSVDDSGNSFLPGAGSSPDSEPYPIPLEGPAVAAQMNCAPAAAARGAMVTCSVSGTSASAVSAWSFSGNGVTVNGPGSALIWYGVMAVSGAITATVNGTPLSQAIAINPRAWHINPAQPAQVDNGALQTSNGLVTLPSPPAASPGPNGIGVYSGLGGSSPALMWTAYNPTVIGTGPNAGFAYSATQLAITNSAFRYEISPDLQNQDSAFSLAQCGNATYISWANLLAQTNRHEWNSGTESHWAFYAASMNSNNVGDYYEARVASPGTDLTVFAGVTNQTLSQLFNQVAADSAGTEGQVLPPGTLVQPYPVNYSAAGQFLGQINYGPNYASCN